MFTFKRKGLGAVSAKKRRPIRFWEEEREKEETQPSPGHRVDYIRASRSQLRNRQMVVGSLPPCCHPHCHHHSSPRCHRPPTCHHQSPPPRPPTYHRHSPPLPRPPTCQRQSPLPTPPHDNQILQQAEWIVIEWSLGIAEWWDKWSQMGTPLRKGWDRRREALSREWPERRQILEQTKWERLTTTDQLAKRTKKGCPGTGGGRLLLISWQNSSTDEKRMSGNVAPTSWVELLLVVLIEKSQRS